MRTSYKFLSVLLLLSLLTITGCNQRKNFTPGVKDGLLSPCPQKPNCVISQRVDEKHFIPPLSYSGSPKNALIILTDIIKSQKYARIIKSTDNYLYAEYISHNMGFIDDVEFYLGQPGIIHVRSSSRSGFYDFRVNRKRIDHIRTLLKNY